MVESLALKLVLALALFGLASWVTWRWGPGAGGWFAALPITSGPVVLILALEQGPAFAKQTCIGVLLAVVSLAAFAVVYAWSAHRWHWGVSSIVGCIGYLACTWRLRSPSASLGWTLGGVCAVLAIAVHVMPADAHAPRVTPSPAAAFVAATVSALAVHAVIWRRMHAPEASVSSLAGVLHE